MVASEYDMSVKVAVTTNCWPVNNIPIFHFWSSAHVRNNCSRLDSSLVARIGYFLQHGWVHSCSSGYRSRNDFAAYRTRSTGTVTLADCFVLSMIR